MKKDKKNLTAGIAVGVILATTAFTVGIAYTIQKAGKLHVVHLFEQSNQEGKETDIDQLIPKFNDQEKSQSRCSFNHETHVDGICKHCGCPNRGKDALCNFSDSNNNEEEM